VKRQFLTIVATILSLLPMLGGSSALAAPPAATSAAPSVSHSIPARPVAVPRLWTETSRTFRVGDRYVDHVYASPVNVRGANGTWQPIDTMLIRSHQAGAAYQTRATSYHATFPTDLGKGMIRIELNKNWLAFGLADVHSRVRVTGNQASYRIPGGQITYTVGSTSLKEGIALSSPASPTEFHYRVQTSAGLVAQRLSTGGIAFRDRAGQVAFRFAPPSMRDAAGARSQAVSMQLRGGSLTLNASKRWLASAHRAYPVVIDPTTVVLNPSQACTLNQAAPSTASCNTTGTLSNVSGAQKNILFQFNLSSIPSNSEVLDANLGLDVTAATGTAPFTVNVYQVTRAWTTAATWNTYNGVNAWTTPGGDTTGVIVAQNSNVYSSGAGFYYFQPVQLVQDWVNGIAANDGFEFKVTSPASSTLTVAASPNPTLTITYAPWLGGLPYWTLDSGVNVANGDEDLAQGDVAVTGIDLPVSIARYFNSLNAGAVGAFGSGWSSTVGPDVKLTINSDGVIDFNGPSGFQVPFFLGAIDPSCRGLCSPSYTSPPGIDADLTNNGSGYTLTFHQSQEKLIFNTSGQLTSQMDRSGNTITFTYDGSGRLSTITDTQGRATSFAYTSPVSSALVSQITDVAGHTYGYSYDNSKNLTVYTNPAGGTTQYSYDASHNLTQITDPDGNETQFTYDASHRVTAIKAVTDNSTGAGYTATYTYNAGNTVVTDPNGHSTTYYYDGRGRVTSFKDPLGDSWQTSWTSNNDVASQVTPSGHTSSYGYDTNHNLTSITSPPVNGSSMTASCAYGNSTWIYQPSSCTDEQGHTTTYGYNSQGLLSTATDASNHTASAVYNSNGTVASETDPNGHTVTHTYYTSGQSTGLPQQDTPPAPLGTTQYTYTAGNIESSVTNGNGKTTSYSYDALEHLLQVTYADGATITYTYDASGNVLSMTDGTGATTYSYNRLNELIGKRLPSGPYLPDGESVDYTYDPVGNLLTKQDSGGTVSYRYDANDQVIGVTDRLGGTYTIGYDQDGNEVSIHYPDNVTESSSYNSTGQLTQIAATNSSQQTLTSFSYSYTNPSTSRPTSLPYSVTDAQGNTTSFSYDVTNQMTQAIKRASGGTTLASYAFGYDAGGNLTSKTVGGILTTFSYNAADELTSASGGLNMAYTYDGNGDRTGSSDGTSISINAAEQITSIAPPGGGLGHGSGTPATYTYTGLAEQFRVSAGSTTFQYDATGLGKQNDSLGSTYYTSLPDGTLLSETVPSGAYAGTYYYLSDGAGNIAAVVDSTGTPRDTYTYDPLGAMTTSGSVPNPFTFQASMYDSVTGYYYTGTDYYDPATGQTFGCKDHGSADARGPVNTGEDHCGEDEPPYDDSTYTFTHALEKQGTAAMATREVDTGGRLQVTVSYLGHNRVDITVTAFAPPHKLVSSFTGHIQFGDNLCWHGNRHPPTAFDEGPQLSVTCDNVPIPGPRQSSSARYLPLGINILAFFCPAAAVGARAAVTCPGAYETTFRVPV
jgi:YD repeat-containing protein